MYNSSRRILEAPSGLVLTLETCYHAAGDTLIMYEYVNGSCHGAKPSNQEFTLNASKDGAVQIVALQSGACVAASWARAVTVSCSQAGTTWQMGADKKLRLGDECLDDPKSHAVSLGDVWARPLAKDGGNDRIAVVLFNPGNSPNTVSASWKELGIVVLPEEVVIFG